MLYAPIRFLRPALLGLALSAAAVQAEPLDLAASEPIPRFAVLDEVRTSDAVLGAPARADKLEAQRGGTDTSNTMRLDGNVRDNSATNVVTGANTIDAGSFANMNGIPMVIQNSGANVLIQNATIINLQFK